MKKSIQLIISLLLVLSLGLAACSGSGTPGAASSAKNDSASQTESKPESANASTATAESSVPAEISTATSEAATESSVEESVPAPEPVHLVFGYLYGDAMTEKIWEAVRDAVADKGVDLELRNDFSDLGILRSAMQQGNVVDIIIGTAQDVSNYPDLYAAIGYTTVTPYNIYSTKHSSVTELTKNDEVAFYGVSYLNNTHIQELLAAAGLITLKNGTGSLKVTDIEEHVYIGYNYRISDIRANLDQFAAAILPAYTDLPDPIFEDPVINDPEYWGRILTTINHVKDPAVLDALEIIVEAYQSQTTLDILEESNSPSVPANWDEDLIAVFR